MASFEDVETEHFWRYVASSLDRLMRIVETEPDEVVRYRPPAPNANSILALARHTLANAGDNLLGVLKGAPTERNRETEFEDMEPQALVDAWAHLRPDLESALAAVPIGGLGQMVEHGRRGVIAARELLIIVARHAAEHLGQAELTRDLARQS